jgi:hypothetical protein
MNSGQRDIFGISILTVLLILSISLNLSTRSRLAENAEKLEALKERATAMEIAAVRLKAQLELVERLCEWDAVEKERK